MLNKLTFLNRYPLPRIDDLIDKLHGAKVFSSIDLQSGFYQIPIVPQDIPKTAFTTPFGLYEWIVLPMGLTNSPATFQNVMNRIFQDYVDKFVVVYLDDIMVFSDNMEEHQQHLRLVLDRLRQYGLTVKPKKCDWAKTEVKFL